jgi:hypothetical protein
MITPQSLTLFDASAMLVMIIIAYLSHRLGEALKIPPYYRILYLTSFVLAVTAFGDTVGADLYVHIPQSILMLLRFVSASVAFFVGLRYWNWAFTEYMKK